MFCDKRPTARCITSRLLLKQADSLARLAKLGRPTGARRDAVAVDPVLTIGKLHPPLQTGFGKSRSLRNLAQRSLAL